MKMTTRENRGSPDVDNCVILILLLGQFIGSSTMQFETTFSNRKTEQLRSNLDWKGDSNGNGNCTLIQNCEEIHTRVIRYVDPEGIRNSNRSARRIRMFGDGRCRRDCATEHMRTSKRLSYTIREPF